jgi:hypothetical protein
VRGRSGKRKEDREEKGKQKHTAAKLAVKWHMMLSSKYLILSSSALKKSYLRRTD